MRPPAGYTRVSQGPGHAQFPLGSPPTADPTCPLQQRPVRPPRSHQYRAGLRSHPSPHQLPFLPLSLQKSKPTGHTGPVLSRAPSPTAEGERQQGPEKSTTERQADGGPRAWSHRCSPNPPTLLCFVCPCHTRALSHCGKCLPPDELWRQ